MTDFIRISEAARILQVTPATIRNWIDKGIINGAHKINPGAKNSPYRIPRIEIDQFLPQGDPQRSDYKLTKDETDAIY